MFFLLWFSPIVGEGRLWECLRIYSGKLFIAIKRQISIGQLPFDSRLYLDIPRSFKGPIFLPMVCLICNYLRSAR